MSDKSSPIGIFDSGLGGLTVVKRILEKLPDESVVYVGDTARIPYGPKSPTVIQDFSRQLSRFLLGRDVKAIVVACNTASAFGLSVLSEFVEVPVLGVVGPSARAAAAASSSGRIGVIGTKGTIGSEAYQNAILTINPEARVFARPAPLLVPMIEEGHHDDEIVRLALGMYLDDLLDQKVDTLVLGCTHYPLLIDTIQKFVGDDVTVVDSAGAAADELAALLSGKELSSTESGGKNQFYSTDDPDSFKKLGENYLGSEIGTVERLSLEELTAHN